MCSVFTVMTDNCHSNTVFVRHVTIDLERLHFTPSIRVDDVSATREITLLDLTVGLISLDAKKKAMVSDVF